MPCNISKAENTESLNLYSNAAILIESKTGSVLYGKNEEEKMYPASTTKILASIIILENCNLDDKVVADRESLLSIPSGYTTCNLQEGEEMSVKDLLTAFLVVSANEAGFVLARHLAGSIPNFAELMNKKAEEIGCKNSHFVNPSGIHNTEHYSTAHDLALIARYCMQNETFRQIVSTADCTIGATNKSETRKLSNTNDLIKPSSKYYIKDCIGIKTGFTSSAQNCLISGFSKDGLELISVILGASSTENGGSARYEDTTTLYNYGYNNFSLKTLVKQGEIIKNIEIANGSKNTKNLNLIAEKDLVFLSKSNIDIPEPTITISENLSAPINQHDVLGSISYTVNGSTYSSNLLAENDVKPTYFVRNLLIVFSGFMVLLSSSFFLRYLKKINKVSRKNNLYRQKFWI